VLCSVTGEETRIAILGTAHRSHHLFRGQYVIAAARTALESELEKVYTRIFMITLTKSKMI
jgi:hypothetical protein